MRKQIAKISLHQTAKTLAIFVFLLSAVLLVPYALYRATRLSQMEQLVYMAYPFIYMLGAYLVVVFCAFLYNVAASSFGGIEFEETSKHH